VARCQFLSSKTSAHQPHMYSNRKRKFVYEGYVFSLLIIMCSRTPMPIAKSCEELVVEAAADREAGDDERLGKRPAARRYAPR